MFVDPAPVEPPAAPVAAVEQVVRDEILTSVVIDTHRNLVLESAGAAEAMIVRYRFNLRASVSQVIPNAGATATIAQPELCRWALYVFLQKDLCFTSISGLTGCTAPTVVDLPHEEHGVVTLDEASAADPQVCTLNHLSVRAADVRLRTAVSGQAQRIADADYDSQVRPMLTKAGVRIRPGR